MWEMLQFFLNLGEQVFKAGQWVWCRLARKGEPDEVISKASQSPRDDALAEILGLYIDGLLVGDSRNQLLQACKRQEAGICVKLQLIFECFARATNVDLLCQGMHRMAALGPYTTLRFSPVLQHFGPNCPGLPVLLRSVCRCCTLFAVQDRLRNSSDRKLRLLCENSMQVLEYILSPLMQREEGGDVLAEEAMDAIATVVGTYTTVLAKTRQEWPDQLPQRLRRAAERVPGFVKMDVVDREAVYGQLKAFTDEVVESLKSLRKRNSPAWIEEAQFLFQPGPLDKPGTAALLWRLLERVDDQRAIRFLVALCEASVGLIWSGPDDQAVFSVDPERAEKVAGFCHHLIVQCCGADSGEHEPWRREVRSNIASYIPVRADALARLVRTRFAVYEYLTRTLAKIDGRYHRPLNRAMVVNLQCSLEPTGTLSDQGSRIGRIESISPNGARIHLRGSSFQGNVPNLAGAFRLVFWIGGSKEVSRGIDKSFVYATHEDDVTIGVQFDQPLPDEVSEALEKEAGGVLI